MGKEHSMRESTARPATRTFMLMEVVISISLLGIVMTGTFSGLRANRSFRRKLMLRNQAILVLDNTVERVSALSAPGLSDVQAVLTEEAAAAGLNKIEGLQATCRAEKDTVRLRIGLGDKPPLAQLRIRSK